MHLPLFCISFDWKSLLTHSIPFLGRFSEYSWNESTKFQNSQTFYKRYRFLMYIIFFINRFIALFGRKFRYNNELKGKSSFIVFTIADWD